MKKGEMTMAEIIYEFEIFWVSRPGNAVHC